MESCWTVMWLAILNLSSPAVQGLLIQLLAPQHFLCCYSSLLGKCNRFSWSGKVSTSSHHYLYKCSLSAASLPGRKMCQLLLFSDLSLFPGDPPLRSLLLILLSGLKNMDKSLSISFTTTAASPNKSLCCRKVASETHSLQSGPSWAEFLLWWGDEEWLSGLLQPLQHHRQEIDGQVLLQEKYFNRHSLIVFPFLFRPFVWYCRLLLTLHWAELAVFSLGEKRLRANRSDLLQ